MPVSFHIEGVSFLIRKRQRAMPFPEDRGWKDTVQRMGKSNCWSITVSRRTSRSISTARRWKMVLTAPDWANAGESSVVKVTVGYSMRISEEGWRLLTFWVLTAGALILLFHCYLPGFCSKRLVA